MVKSIAPLLKLLPVVGPVVAALPEFKAIWDDLSATFGDADQATLQQAYELAVSRAEDAHADLQRLVAERS